MQEIREIEPLALALALALTLALTLQATRCWRSRRRAICWEAERERGGGKGRGLKSYRVRCRALDNDLRPFCIDSIRLYCRTGFSLARCGGVC